MAYQELSCRGCGVQFIRPKSVGQIPKFCSVKCRDRYRRRENVAHRLEIERRAASRRRAKIGYLESTRRTAQIRSFERYKNTNTTRVCEICEIKFCNLLGKHSWMTVCSDECAEVKRRRSKVRKEKARRIRKRIGVADIVDPFKVFSRDGWRCMICSCNTPKKLRGTYDQKAPELDHIIPLSVGGTHTYDNVQCSCRSCNRKKGATVYGQLNMFCEPVG